jgi:3-oxoadipyl-CoA thiolase
MRRAAIISALRTPIGAYGGTLSAARPDDLAAHVIRALLDRTRIDPELIEDVYLGATNQAGEDNRNVARMAALLAGLPPTVPGCTVNRLCASGLEAVNIAARVIESGQADVIIAGGVESMSRAPLVIPKPEVAFPRDARIFDSTIGWRFTNPSLAERYHPYSMGETAENVARQFSISRADQDAFALTSQQKWAAAKRNGRFEHEIVAVPVPQRKGLPLLVDTDEHPRPETTLETLSKLRPAFAGDEHATVTAGNSSGINDGAAALLLVEAATAQRLGFKPLALIGYAAAAGVDPAYMGLGPIPAVRALLKRSEIRAGELDIIELNEAFAAQALACIRELGLQRANINPNGGAIAIGHPLGCTGARLAATLAHEISLTGARHAMATLCVGVGQGVATLLHGVP